jgi:hypothetical protein
MFTFLGLSTDYKIVQYVTPYHSLIAVTTECTTVVLLDCVLGERIFLA